ncbi:hypothetical protein MSPP1_003000 [Malassezia sp. CBS 17886]|nr:hypothetical protein MSPP1_003000 [Malassezia sp. CBS 17886]
MPYRLVRPLLQQCRPEQLRVIEDASPHLTPNIDEIWRRACVRDFAELRRMDTDGSLQPRPSWRALYEEKQQQTEEAKALATAKIKGRYAEHCAEKAAKRLVVSDTALPHGRARKRAAPVPPRSALQTKGQAILARAREGTAKQRRMTLVPPRGLAARGAEGPGGSAGDRGRAASRGMRPP